MDEKELSFNEPDISSSVTDEEYIDIFNNTQDVLENDVEETLIEEVNNVDSLVDNDKKKNKKPVIKKKKSYGIVKDNYENDYIHNQNYSIDELNNVHSTYDEQLSEYTDKQYRYSYETTSIDKNSVIDYIVRDNNDEVFQQNIIPSLPNNQEDYQHVQKPYQEYYQNKEHSYANSENYVNPLYKNYNHDVFENNKEQREYTFHEEQNGQDFISISQVKEEYCTNYDTYKNELERPKYNYIPTINQQENNINIIDNLIQNTNTNTSNYTNYINSEKTEQNVSFSNLYYQNEPIKNSSDISNIGNPENYNQEKINKENREQSVSDIRKELIQTEKEKYEYTSNIHDFKAVVQYTHSHLERAGNQAVNLIVDKIKTADEYTQATTEEIDKAKDILQDVITIIGACNIMDLNENKASEFEQAGRMIDDLVQKGQISLNLLNDDKGLKKELKKNGFSGLEIENILSNKDDVKNLYNIKDILNTLSKDGKITEMTEGMYEKLNSSKLFNIKDNDIQQLLNCYYMNSDNDVIRNILGGKSFYSLKEKDFKKLISNKDKNGLSDIDVSAIKLGMLSRFSQSGTMTLNQRIKAILGVGVGRLHKIIKDNDENTSLISNDVMRLYRLSMRTYGTVRTSSSIVKKLLIGTKKGGYKGILSQMVRVNNKVFWTADKYLVNGIYRQTLDAAKNDMKGIANYLNDKLVNAKNTGNKVLNSTKQSMKKGVVSGVRYLDHKVLHDNIATWTNMGKTVNNAYRKTSNSISKKIINFKNKKPVKHASNFAKGIGKTIKAPAKFAKKSAQIISKSLKKIMELIGSVKKWIIGIGIFAVLLYFLLMFFMSIFLQSASSQYEAVSKIMFAEDDNFIKDKIIELKEDLSNRKEEAKQKGEGVPIHPEVWAGHTITAYGLPKYQETRTLTDSHGHEIVDIDSIKNSDNWIKGWRMYYVDKQGNQILDVTSNVKDVMTLSYVQQFGNWSNIEKDAEVLDEWFLWLNPKITDDCCIESDIQACSYGCETVYYRCNDTISCSASGHSYVSQAEIQSDKSAGAHFYGEIISNSNGDYYITTCNGCTKYDNAPDDCSDYSTSTDVNGNETYSCNGHDVNHGTGYNSAPSGCSNYSTTYYCSGHSVDACYGHKTVTIEIPLYRKEDAFQEQHKINISGMNETDLSTGNWSEADIAWINTLYNQDWYSIYNEDPDGGYGFSLTYDNP